jgi:ribonuclease BN (tRNA processing enzyme)
MIIRYWFFILFLITASMPVLAGSDCDKNGVWLQVLGSGGPETGDKRASTGYLIWHDGRARILVDMGGGSMLRFEHSGADLNDLDMILLTHLHVDHSADLPTLIKASYFSGRDRDLPLYGPTGNKLMPATASFVRGLFAPGGIYHYLSGYLDGTERYQLIPHNISASGREQQSVLMSGNYRVTAIPVHHGPIPALAWRVELAGKSIVFSGDMNNDYNTLSGLATDADLLVAHHAIPEHAGRIARNLHMPPSVIGQVAESAGIKRLVLSHRMLRTIGHEQETKALISERYPGPIVFSDDLQCFKP